MRRPGRRAAKKRMLLIVNPYATTVSDRLKNLVVYALQGRYEVETVSTEAQNHATEIGREARDHGHDVVVAFGGDGTLNEVANGLAGTDVPTTYFNDHSEVGFIVSDRRCSAQSSARGTELGANPNFTTSRMRPLAGMPARCKTWPTAAQ